MYPITIALKAKIALDGSETEKRVGAVLFDEAVQVLSTFELNQIASLTYSDETCDQIFELLALVMSNPMENSILAVQKSLVITTHALTYGSEKCVNSSWGLARWVTRLCEFNTVLMAQNQKGVSSWWQTVKGGAVDRGFPVREAAQKLQALLSDEVKVRQLRADMSDPNSLVPVGDGRVAYASDEVRLFILKKRMQEQQLIITKSNLAKAQGGYGGGYNTKDGKTVVGAAHSLDEMMARADREKKKYTDDGPVYVKPETPPAISWEQPSPTVVTMPPHTIDLLDMGATVPQTSRRPAPEMNLLDFSTTAVMPPAPAPMDFFAAPLPAPASASLLPDPFAITMTPATEQIITNGMGDLLNVLTISSPPTSIFDFADQPTVNNIPAQSLPTMTHIPALTDLASPQPSTTTFMKSNVDRFAALDELAGPETKVAGSAHSGLEAQNRILSFAMSTPTMDKPVPDLLGSMLNNTASSFASASNGESLGLTVPSSGNDVSTMMEIGPSPGSMVPSFSTEYILEIHQNIGQSEVNGGNSAPSRGMSMMGNIPLAGDSMMGLQPDYSYSHTMMIPPPMSIDPPPILTTGGIPGISEHYGPPLDEDDDHGGFGFAMGGISGSGLGEPLGLPPSVPPPPPPGL